MSKGRTTVKPRKVPAQARSRATVDAIVQAATYILTRVGWEGLTTNAIAERAGVNIGSLYQFFPNKEAVIAELQRRHVAATRSDLLEALKELPQKPSLRDALTLIVEMLVNEHSVAPAVHKAIHEELPYTVRQSQDADPLRRQFADVLRPFMKNVPDPELSIYLMGISAHAIIHTVTADRPALLGNPQFVAEVVTLLENYLHREQGQIET
ncbi:TetR/AcrR family transcriptional regulator [Pseudomonas lijiangensis]|uniref:TetR/AcrR family transcriptional regulator n=1 Tax=Pseudomonas lijiangensis TaxID=2995658 RepID=A0ABX8HJV7_9PSED|nr:TetR/AcrR family transcriptional regulator [Pseudomonas lijiangensis]MBX8518880.1 TetR/AcrR family transcriptional regulator [Pseudomonas cichorii]MBX8498504.1 TetR/AcrR family transcriptional regulator [Pseudomonas lijiangensis]MBX8503412.1 TetR/AcrR family transcriptional regulator [Pseudomonas lijiangensis]MBX8548142.1 TetR/AcrR family transcriptional regulator [Pseudomonas cichorii]MBX8583134.1 TetR/AcrR family transcriptional regulator [Pseudomonas cichorii]